MAKLDIARALKDKSYFANLSEAEKAQVHGTNPIGDGELPDAELESVSGGLSGGGETVHTTTTATRACVCEDGIVVPDCHCCPAKDGDLPPS